MCREIDRVNILVRVLQSSRTKNQEEGWKDERMEGWKDGWMERERERINNR